MRPVNWSNPINWNHPLNKGLVGWYLNVPHWQGGTVWRDLTKRFDGTLTDMAPAANWISTNKLGGWGALDFNGGYVQVASPVLPDGSFTVIASFSRRSFVNSHWLLDNGTSTDGGFQLFIVGSSDVIRARIDDSGANGGVFDTTTTITTDVPHRVALVADVAGLATLYLDGKQDGGTLDISGYGDISGTENLRIGERDSANDPAPSSPFDGLVDSIVLYDRILTPADLSLDYQLAQQFYPGLLNRRSMRVVGVAAEPPAGGITAGSLALAGVGI